MLIPVIYPDGRHDMVKEFILTKLIEENGIEKFKRSDGWVDIDSDKVRGKRWRPSYAGPERRRRTLELEASIGFS